MFLYDDTPAWFRPGDDRWAERAIVLHKAAAGHGSPAGEDSAAS